MFRVSLWVLVAGMLTACGSNVPPHLLPIPKETRALMAKKNIDAQSPMFVRIFKEESELEVWKQATDGRFRHLKTYPICNWSGGLGPKLKQGDKQAPEGFYTVARRQLNPKSQFHLAFNLGYPNKYDKSHGRTGDFLMVHGDCRSAGCYAMTDALIEEIYALARESLKGGQEKFHVHAFPFRMTNENLRRHRRNKWARFWRTMKQGYDHFEISRQVPDVKVCNRSYLINAQFVTPNALVDPRGPCPAYERLPIEQSPWLPDPQQTARVMAPGKKMRGERATDFAYQSPRQRTYRGYGLTVAPPSLFGWVNRNTAKPLSRKDIFSGK